MYNESIMSQQNKGNGPLGLFGICLLTYKSTNHIVILHTEIHCSSSRLFIIAVQIKGLLIAASCSPMITHHLPVIMAKVAESTAEVWVQLCSLKWKN